MKKLMIAAVVAAVAGGTFAANCGPGVEPVKESAWVYQWKFTGKTTEGANVADVEVKGNCGPQVIPAGCTIRAPASLKIQGYTYFCNPGCSSDFFPKFAEGLEVFWQTKPFKTSLAGGVTTEICHIIGRAAKKCEVYGTAAFDGAFGWDEKEQKPIGRIHYDIAYAGLGKMAQTDSRKHVTSVSGNFAGTLSQPWLVTSTKCALAGYWNCADLSLVCTDPSVVYGKWSAKYKYAASENYVNGKMIALPSWVQWLNK